MRIHNPPIAPVVKRLTPILELLFEAYELNEEQRQQVIDRGRDILLFKWNTSDRPDRWFLRLVIDGCRDLVGELRAERPPERPREGASLKRFRRKGT